MLLKGLKDHVRIVRIVRMVPIRLSGENHGLGIIALLSNRIGPRAVKSS